ncbi:unnamed protein product [Anisakis simplex]|uniref:Serine/threonine-protein phosphatase PGAM5, mitochondrial n=1 Tax=Anisakis simplex TaxID=6269 RepID=A0A0M3JU86_ANISI|nr:unnamed protein product [Anisakis simplex]
MAILSRMAKIAIPLTVAAATASAVFYENLRDGFTTRAAQPVTSTHTDGSLPSLSTDLFPRNKWHSDWDSRDPLSLVDPVKYEAADASERKEMLKKVKPTATRNIFLIRHGQYAMDTDEKNLTPLGREQAVLLGKRLAESGKKFDVLIMSSMTRACETANLILKEISPMQTKVDAILEEGAPYPPEPSVTHWKPKQKVSLFFEFDFLFYLNSFLKLRCFRLGSRIEAAFRKYMHRANPKQKQDSYEVIVCHANVIRYFVCRIAISTGRMAANVTWELFDYLARDSAKWQCLIAFIRRYWAFTS